MKRRLLIIALALVFAGIGTSGVLAYAKGADARAITGMKAVSVLVAKKAIPSGTSAGAALRSGLLGTEKLPAASVPSDAVRSVTSALAPLFTSAAVQPGQLLLRALLVKKAVHASVPGSVPGSVTLPQGMIAVTVNFCLPEAVAGDLQAGSLVAVFDTIVPGAGSAGAGCSGQHVEQPGTVQTRVVLARVQVMSVGTPPAGGASSAPTASSAAQSSSTGSSTLVTLAVSQADAERLIQVSVTGLPYLALLSSASRTSVDAGRLLDSHSIPTPTPTAAKPSPTPTPTKPSPSPTPTKSSPQAKPTPTK